MGRTTLTRIVPVVLATCMALATSSADAPSDDPLGVPLWMAASPQEDDNIQTTARQFHGVAFSVLGGSTGITSVLDELGTPDRSLWRFGRWNAAGGAYREVGTGLVDIALGEGYWLITSSNQTIGYTGNPAPADSFDIPLSFGPNGAPAWNQVGNPFRGNVNLSTVVVVKRDSMIDLDSPNNRHTQTAVKIWDPLNGVYVNAAEVAPNTAFWTKVVDPDTSARWTVWNVPSTGFNPQLYDLAIDAQGDQHLVFMNSSRNLVYAVRRKGLWTIDPAPYQFASQAVSVSMALDANGLPWVALATGAGGGHCTLVRKTGPGWTSESVDPRGDTGTRLSLALDPQGNPHVAYNAAFDTLYYASRGAQGNWTYQPIAGGNTNNVRLAIDNAGTPHVVNYGPDFNFEFRLRYFTAAAGDTWPSQDFRDGDGDDGVSIATDAQNRVHMTYNSIELSNRLVYKIRQNGVWSSAEQVGSGYNGQWPSLELDANGNPFVVFVDANVDSLRLARKIGGVWRVENVVAGAVASNPGDQVVPAIGLGPGGRPSVGFSFGPSYDTPRLLERTGAEIRLRIPYVAPGPQSPQLASVAPVKPERAEWALEITPSAGGRSAEPVVVGVWSAAREHPSHARIGRAPAPPGVVDGPAMAIVADALGDRDVQGDGAPLELTRSLVPAGDRLEWTLVIEGGTSSGEIELAARAFDLPADVRVWLLDDLMGWTAEITPGSSVRVAATPAGRTLRLVALRDGTAPATGIAAGSLRAIAPNPFTAGTTMLFTQPTPGSIRIELFDLQGRRVRNLERPGASAGGHAVVWDGRDEQGGALAGGVYLARWSLAGRAGVAKLIKLE